MTHRNYGRDLVELADLIRLVVRNPDDAEAVERLRARLRRSDTSEFTKALVLVMLVAQPTKH
jgi:hypothetical protein